MKIAVIGAGYVGLANALLLSQHDDVVTMDIDKHKVAMLNRGEMPVIDKKMAQFLQENELSLRATSDFEDAIKDASYVLIATPTDYDPTSNCFDTLSVQDVIRKTLSLNKDAIIVIKSTIPVGFVDEVSERNQTDRVVFSPEFLREEHALYDSLYPFRIIVGHKGEYGEKIARLFQKGTRAKDVPLFLTGRQEAESIKLFSNTYLAMRIAFFNELDSFALARSMNVSDIIKGVCFDRRIGEHYNNPSFGYGGYCLPKDTKQLLANYQQVPQNLIRAIVEANSTRKLYLAQRILKERPKVVGIYRLVSEPKSGNFRQSAVQDIMHFLHGQGVKVIIFEPLLSQQTYEGIPVINDLATFKKEASVILANRLSDELKDVSSRVFSRDDHRQLLGDENGSAFKTTMS